MGRFPLASLPNIQVRTLMWTSAHERNPAWGYFGSFGHLGTQGKLWDGAAWEAVFVQESCFALSLQWDPDVLNLTHFQLSC